MKDNQNEYSKLERINRYAKTLSGPGNEVLSAENYLLAVVNLLTNEEVPPNIFIYGFDPISSSM